MHDTLRTGRLVGLMMLLQTAAGIALNFGLLRPVFAAPGFLVNAAPHAFEMRLSILLGLTAGALTAAIAIAAWPLFRRTGERLALAFVALAVTTFAIGAVESAGHYAMLGLSQAYQASGDAASFEAARASVAALRNGLHHTGQIVAGFMLLVFFAALLRSASVPRVLAIAGLVAAPLHIVAVAQPLFGLRLAAWMMAPLALAYLGLAGCLLVRGFRPAPEKAP